MSLPPQNPPEAPHLTQRKTKHFPPCPHLLLPTHPDLHCSVTLASSPVLEHMLLRLLPPPGTVFLRQPHSSLPWLLKSACVTFSRTPHLMMLFNIVPLPQPALVLPIPFTLLSPVPIALAIFSHTPQFTYSLSRENKLHRARIIVCWFASKTSAPESAWHVVGAQ